MDPATIVCRSHGKADRSALPVVPPYEAASAPTGRPRRSSVVTIPDLVDRLCSEATQVQSGELEMLADENLLPVWGAKYARSTILVQTQTTRQAESPRTLNNLQPWRDAALLAAALRDAEPGSSRQVFLERLRRSFRTWGSLTPSMREAIRQVHHARDRDIIRAWPSSKTSSTKHFADT